MGIDRYSKDDEGFRKYVELLESTPIAKRKKFLEAARKENEAFAEAAEKYTLTFERITQLPPLELTEVLGDPTVKLETLAVALGSIENEELREKILAAVPRTIAPRVLTLMKDNGKPDAHAAGGARLQIIQAARALEKNGKLQSVQIPRFGLNHFRSRW